MDVLSAVVIAFAFFTVVPMPKPEWTGKRMCLVPLMLPVIGLVNGFIAYGLVILLSYASLTPFLKAAAMTLYFIVFTGGLHLDGFMDAADAYFSRRDKERKLEIMKDSGVGAFAVVSLFFLLLLKTACFYELFSREENFGLPMLFIPVFSRLLQASMLYVFPHAKQDGLTKVFGDLKVKNAILLYLLFVAAGLVLFALAGARSLLIPLSAAAYYGIFYISSKRQFGGITGDLLGAFLEVSELVMLVTILFI